MGKCWQIPASFKQEVIEYIKTNKCSPHAAYVHFSKTQKMDYNESMYYQWYKNKEKIMTLNKISKRCKGAGRTPKLSDLEEMLFDKIVEMRTQKMKVSQSLVQAQAMSLARDAGIGDFKASSTWCTSFMSRFKLSLRRTTNLTTLTDNQLIQRAVDYMKFLRQTLPTIALNRTLLMDETAVYFEDCRTQTIDFEG